eukprot:4308160-Amphidinium_carterae.1
MRLMRSLIKSSLLPQSPHHSPLHTTKPELEPRQELTTFIDKTKIRKFPELYKPSSAEIEIIRAHSLPGPPTCSVKAWRLQ